MKTVCSLRLFNCVAILAIVLFATFGSYAQGALNLTNPSFETPDIPDFFAIDTPTGWTAIDPSNSRRIIDGAHVETAVTLTPANMTGTQFVIIGGGFTLGDGSGTGTDLFQNIGTTNGLSNVTLLVDTAHRGDYPNAGGIPPGDITIGIWRDTDANSIPDLALATLPVLALAETNAFLPKSVTAFLVPGGTELYVRFTASNSAPNFEGFRQTLIDNVRVVAPVVPEPASVLLLGFGAIVLGAFRLRRRN